MATKKRGRRKQSIRKRTLYKKGGNLKRFESRHELISKVQAYFDGDNRERNALTRIYGPISDWDTSIITNMTAIFIDSQQISQEPIILNWNTSRVTTMLGMFQGCAQNFILNFSNTSNVTNMTNMFRDAINFNSPVEFDTSNVVNMSEMFRGASNFNQPVMFNTSNVVNMSMMFRGASNFNQPIMFNTSNVRDMSEMFRGASNFNQPIMFNTGNVVNMSSMFYNAIRFNSPVEFTDTSNVRSAVGMFLLAESFNQPIIFNFTNVQVNEIHIMFGETHNFREHVDIELSPEVIASVDLELMFFNSGNQDNVEKKHNRIISKEYAKKMFSHAAKTREEVHGNDDLDKGFNTIDWDEFNKYS